MAQRNFSTAQVEALLESCEFVAGGDRLVLRNRDCAVLREIRGRFRAELSQLGALVQKMRRQGSLNELYRSLRRRCKKLKCRMRELDKLAGRAGSTLVVGDDGVLVTVF